MFRSVTYAVVVWLVVGWLLVGVAAAATDQSKGGTSEETAADATSAQTAGEAATAADADSVSLTRRIAHFTQDAAEGGIAQLERALSAVSAVGDSRMSVEWARFGGDMARLALVVVATFALFLLLRWLAQGVFARAAQWAVFGDSSLAVVRRVIAVVAAVAVDALVVVLAWMGGYAVALFALGDSGTMATEHSLFLNAFLGIEVLKLLIRMLFAAKDDGLRLLPIAAADARYWNRRIAGLTGFLGYGLMLVKPVVDTSLSVALGSVLAAVIKLVGFAYAALVIGRNRRVVRDKLLARASRGGGVGGFFVAMAARSWHMIAILYLTALMLASMVNPEVALPFMMAATGQTVVAIAVGVFASVLLGQLMQRPLRLPESTRATLPLLEQRLNAFVPMGLRVVRVLIGVVVTAVAIDAWRFLFDLREWLSSEFGATVVGALVSVLLIVVLATALWLGFTSWIEHRLNPNVGRGDPGSREKTLLSLFRNAGTIAIVAFTVMIALSELGVNIGPLLAGAGVLGLAIGFGAQKLVQDIITGVFIQFENAINDGDFITVAGISGTVERLSIRSVGLRDLSGTLHLVPFSAVDTVSNYMRQFAYHLGVYRVALGEDIDTAIDHLHAAFEELRQDPAEAPKLLGDLEVDGVTELADSAINIRVRIMTTPGDQWAVGRAYNRIVKQHFDAAGIEIPFPHRTLYFGDNGKPSLAAPDHQVGPTGDEQLAPEQAPE